MIVGSLSSRGIILLQMQIKVAYNRSAVDPTLPQAPAPRYSIKVVPSISNHMLTI
jgi:hypothetical protein